MHDRAKQALEHLKLFRELIHGGGREPRIDRHRPPSQLFRQFCILYVRLWRRAGGQSDPATDWVHRWTIQFADGPAHAPRSGILPADAGLFAAPAGTILGIAEGDTMDPARQFHRDHLRRYHDRFGRLRRCGDHPGRVKPNMRRARGRGHEADLSGGALRIPAAAHDAGRYAHLQ